MAQIKTFPKLQVEITLSLNEEEARALDAIAGYGFDSFINFFYETMGTTYLKPHENGLKTLFEGVRSQLPQFLSKMDKAKKEFCNGK